MLPHLNIVTQYILIFFLAVCIVGLLLLIWGFRIRKRKGRTPKSYALIIGGITLCLLTGVLAYNAVTQRYLDGTRCYDENIDSSTVTVCDWLSIWNVEESHDGVPYSFWTPGTRSHVFNQLAKQADEFSIHGNTLTLTMKADVYSVLSLGKGHYTIARASENWDDWIFLPKRDYTPPPPPVVSPSVSGTAPTIPSE
jgi:hypothetical protein